MQVTAKCPKINKEATIEYNFGENVKDAISMFGEDVVFNGFKADAVVTLQSAIRRYLEKGQDPAILSNEWKPGQKAPSIAADPKAAALAAFAKMTVEDKQALIEQIRAMSA